MPTLRLRTRKKKKMMVFRRRGVCDSRRPQVVSRLGGFLLIVAVLLPLEPTLLPSLALAQKTQLAQLEKAKELFDEGDYRRAAQLLREVLAGAPNHQDANILLSFALARSVQTEAAIVQARRTLRIVGENVHMQLLLAGLLSAEPSTRAEAISIYREILERHPDSLRARERLAENLRREGAVLESAESLEELIKQQPDEPRYHISIAENYLLLGEIDLAVDEYKNALDLNANNVEVLSRLAVIYETMDQFKESEAAYERLADLEPKSLEYKLALKRVRGEARSPLLPIPLERMKETPLERYLENIGNAEEIELQERQVSALRRQSYSRFLPFFTFMRTTGDFQNINNVGLIRPLDSAANTYSFAFDVRTILAHPAEERIHATRANIALLKRNIGREVIRVYYSRISTVLQYENLRKRLILEPGMADDAGFRRIKNGLKYDLIRLTEQLYLLTGLR